MRVVVLVALAAIACGPVDTGAGSVSGGADGGPIWSGGGPADAGTVEIDAGTAVSGCDGVVPAENPASQSAVVPHGGSDACFYATTDGQGEVAAESHSDEVAHWQIWAPSGAVAGRCDARFDFYGQPSGFEGTRADSSGVTLVRFSAQGTDQLRTELAGKGCAATAFLSVPGGSLALGGCGDSLNATRFGPEGRPTVSRVVIDGKSPKAAGLVDAAGRTLIVVSPGSEVGLASRSAARWYDGALSPLTAWFELAASDTDVPFLRPLIGGGAVIQSGGDWIAQVQSGSAVVSPAPEWLAAHPLHDVQIVRQARAYALVPKFGAAASRNVLELYDAAGERCGAGTFPGEGLSVGMEGTVIASSGEGGCSLQWWTGVLR